MLCSNDDCQHSGFSPTGLCPKCGEKMIPNHLIDAIKKKKEEEKPHPIKALGQVVVRSIEAVLLFGLLYGLMWVLVFGYNGLCTEIPDWTRIDFNSQIMRGVKAFLLIVVIVITFRMRWRSRWY